MYIKRSVITKRFTTSILFRNLVETFIRDDDENDEEDTANFNIDIIKTLTKR